MKILVEGKLSIETCPFCSWRPYPSIIEQSGHYICDIDGCDCSIEETYCRYMKELGDDYDC